MRAPLTDSEIEAMPYMLTVDQAAALLGVSRRTAYNHIADGTLPAHAVGGVWRVAKPDALIYAGLWHLVDRRYWERCEDVARHLRRYRFGYDAGDPADVPASRRRGGRG